MNSSTPSRPTLPKSNGASAFADPLPLSNSIETLLESGVSPDDMSTQVLAGYVIELHFRIKELEEWKAKQLSRKPSKL
jgi:hypothetical protein